MKSVYGWADGRLGVRYVITKFSRMDNLPNFLTHGAPLRAREISAIKRCCHLHCMCYTCSVLKKFEHYFLKMLFFRARLNIPIFLPILGRTYSCIIPKI